MKSAIIFAVGLFAGTFLTLVMLAARVPEIGESAEELRAFRAMGCDPFEGPHRALHSGCDHVKHLTLENK